MILKKCYVCSEEKEDTLRNFAPRTSRCRLCRNAHIKNQYKKNRKKILARCKKYYYRNKEAHRIRQQRYLAKKQPVSYEDKILHARSLIKAAKTRARLFKVPFNLSYEDIPIPDNCPVLGFRLVRNHRAIRFNSATIDRIVPELGYVKGNVIVVSAQVNMTKSHSTIDDLSRIVDFYREYLRGTNANIAS